MRLVFLDTGPLGLITNPRDTPRAEACRAWAKALVGMGVRLFVPEIADYELRRELLRAGKSAGLRRLDFLKNQLEYAPITTDVMIEAARLWADVRRAGRPTASADALDGDCILAALALLSAGPDDTVTVATENVGHLSRFVATVAWEQVS
jgi:predicted nucleic acid-binding protein